MRQAGWPAPALNHENDLVGAHPFARHPGPPLQSGVGFCAGLWGCEGTVAAQIGGHDQQAFWRFALTTGGVDHVLLVMACGL